MPAKAKKKTVTAYVVHRFDWLYNDEYYYAADEAGEPVKTFLDRAKAEAYRDEKEKAFREGSTFVSPFEMNDLDWAAQSSLTVAEARRRLQAASLDPPRGDGDYYDWWHRHHDRWTPEQRDAVWAVMDKARFFTVVETEVELDG